MPGYYIKQGNVGIGEATNPDATLTVKSIRAADVSLRIENCDTTQTGNLIEAYGTGGSAVLTVSVAGVLSTSAAQYIVPGTSAAPGLAFSGDTDTGIYRPAANQIALAAYGSAGLVLDGDTAAAQQVCLVEPGTSATPALTWLTSATDGIYHYGANQVAIGAAASAVAVFKGGAAVEQVLIKPGGTSATPALAWVGDADTGLYASGANVLGLVAGGSAVAFVSGGAASEAILMATLGSSAKPSYSWIGDPDTGMWGVAGGVYLGGAGSAVMFLSAGSATCEQIQSVGLGTSALPAYSFKGDVDTGLYSPAANLVSLAVQGSAALGVVATDGASVRLGCKATALALTAASAGVAGVAGQFCFSEAASCIYVYTGTVWTCAGLTKIG